MKSVEEEYKKYTQHEHVLNRPDTYIGSVEDTTEPQWIFDTESKRMQHKVLTYSPGLFKTYDELIVNAVDQTQRDTTLDTIKVSISKENKCITVENNGIGIPVSVHKEHDIHVPELIFANLLTSSNYNDNEKRTTGGKNGYGAKLANIYSTRFELTVIHPESKMKYTQVFTDNMRKIEKPKLEKCKDKKGLVRVTYWPDLKRFGHHEFTDDFVRLISRRVYDIAACTPKKVNCYLNGEKIPVKNWDDYVNLYIGTKQECWRVSESPNERWDVIIAPSQHDFRQVSFVNGLATVKGGSHVEHVITPLIRKTCDELSKKIPGIKSTFIKNHMFVAVRAVLENPSFDSQIKETCTSRYNTFGSRCDLSDKFVKAFIKSPIIEEARALAKHKETRDLNKTDGKKKHTVKGLPKLDDANKAGTAESHKCTLLLTEGDSAKALVIAGLSSQNRNYWGVYPLRGKLLNVREATTKQLLENAELNALKLILGLEQDKEYNSINELRYGRIMICTDADHDGFHIRGLIMNLFATFWPSLLKYDGFVTSLVTPVVKATKGSQVIEFQNMIEYNTWKESSESKGWKIKYYKGLGTSTSAEGREYFKSIDKNTLTYENTEETIEHMDLAFEKSKADARKRWLLEDFVPLNSKKQKVSYSQFVNQELIQFSHADNTRSIPSMMDGMKPSQRKVLFSLFKKNTKEELKVARFSGYVSEQTSYHHGEASIQGTIINMAQSFVGSNNINLLEPCGQFGTRIQGGKDAASPRYISTKLSPITKHIFQESDNSILNYLNDDGQSIEPEYYAPVIPVVLVNGCDGIGTGWSSKVPLYNPKDVVENVKRYNNGLELNQMIPWYKNFKGVIEQSKPGSFETRGVWKFESGRYCDTLTVTELPIGRWTQDFKELVESYRDGTHTNKKAKHLQVNAYDNHSTEDSVKFVIQLKCKCISEDDIPSLFKLTSSVSTTNMHLFDEKNKIKKFESPEDIIKHWCDVRKELYDQRKTHQLKTLKRELQLITNKIKFMELVMDDKITVFRRSKAYVEEQCAKFELTKVNGCYKYLTALPLDCFIQEELTKLYNYSDKLKRQVKELTESTVTQLWMKDLNEIKV